MNRKKYGSDRIFPDFSRLIQSIQRIEGNPDCFGTAGEVCDRLDCQWRCYCLKKLESQLITENGGGRNEGSA
jgi:hypothetical protein